MAFSLFLSIYIPMLLTAKKTSKNIIASYNRDNNILFISLYSSSSGIELNSKRVRWNFFLSRVLSLSFFFLLSLFGSADDIHCCCRLKADNKLQLRAKKAICLVFSWVKSDIKIKTTVEYHQWFRFDNHVVIHTKNPCSGSSTIIIISEISHYLCWLYWNVNFPTQYVTK